MLVKIIAMGLTPAVWKNVFHHLRNRLPNQPFAAGIFSTSEELAYLTGEYQRRQWGREEAEFLFCDLVPGAEGKKRLAFLKKISTDKSRPKVELVLTLSTLEKGIKQLVQGADKAALLVDGKIRFSIADPAFVIRDFPGDFPRIRVNNHLTALRLKVPVKGRQEIPPSALKPGTLLGFREIEAIIRDEEALSPAAWLKAVLRDEKAHVSAKSIPGLIRESNGLYLCPGIPSGRITGAVLNGVTFSRLFELGQLTEDSPHFEQVCDALRKSGQRLTRRWREALRKIRIAESKADLPLVCGGGAPVIRETLAALLTARGFQRCSTLESPSEGKFREPALLLQIGPWNPGEMNAQLEEPMVVPLEESLAASLEPLQGLLDWSSLPYRRVTVNGPPLGPQSFAEQREELTVRHDKAQQAGTLAENRRVMLEQEIGVLRDARTRLSGLLEARETVQVWSGSVPSSVKEVLVFSFDPEEAGAVLQALSGIGKKRWFDLSPYSDPEALRGLSLEHLKSYFEKGFVTITASARERLNHISDALEQQLADAGRALAECGAAQRFYREEIHKTGLGKEALARQWIHDSLDGWLTDNFTELMRRMDPLRTRHERSWFSRALVSRVAVVSAMRENRDPILAACREVYPGFNPEQSRVVNVTLESFSNAAREARPAASSPSGRSIPGEAEASEVDEEAVARETEPPPPLQEALDGFLADVAGELRDVRCDLLIIEYDHRTAFSLLEYLRRALPGLEEVPAVLILPEPWVPGEHEALPWPHTRLVPLRRLGPLTQEECARSLRGLYSA